MGTSSAPLPEDVSDLANRAADFQNRLNEVKASLAPAEFDWYPYDSIGNVYLLTGMLTGDYRSVGDILGAGPLLDICCADGELSFALEDQGYRVHAVDWPPTNYNGMRGVVALKDALGSSVDIHKVDLDSQFELPREHYSAAFFFGGLYHLKNPFYVLEALAKRATFCFLTTRIAKFAPDKQTDLQRWPVAYLVPEGEANSDATNYWIFSEAGLKTVLHRANWDLCQYMTLGNTGDSDPLTNEGDQRAWCLLRSRVAGKDFAFDSETRVRLGSGWHEIEEGQWRWTESRFSVSVRNAKVRSGIVTLHFTLPQVVLDGGGPVTLSGVCNGVALLPRTYSKQGQHVYRAKLPAMALPQGTANIEFALDRALPPDSVDQRERGIVVACDRIADLLQ